MCTNGTQRSLPRCQSLPNPTTRKGSPHHRGLWPLLFSNSDVGSFTSHKNKSVKVLRDRTYGFSSLSEKTRKSNHLQMSLQRPWVSARPGFEPATSRSADRRSPNWANQAAVNLDLLNDLGPFLMSIILFQIDSDGFTDLEMHTLCHVCNWMSACLRLSASFISTLMALDCFCATLRPLFYRTKVTCVDVVKIIGCGILLAAFILNGEGLQTL